MAPRQLHHVLVDCRATLGECRRFATDAQNWSTQGSPGRISTKRRDWIVELSFLRAFLAFEAFLEEAFVLYSLGRAPPRGKPPHRFTFPPTRNDAVEWLKEGREYAAWGPSKVTERAHRYFRGGGPFTSALRGSQATLDEARTIRNAIAHELHTAQEKFEVLVRRKLGTLPSGLSIGGFLGTTFPASNPPQSFLDLYLDQIELVATQIVPPR